MEDFYPGSLQPAFFQEAEVARPVEDDVVEQTDPDDRAGRLELPGDLDVAGRRFEGAAGVVVGDDHGGGSIGKGVGKNLPRMHGAAINQPNGDHSDIQNLVGTVDGGTQEMLLFAVGVVADVGKQVGRGDDLGTFRLDAASGKFNGRKNRRCLCIPS